MLPQMRAAGVKFAPLCGRLRFPGGAPGAPGARCTTRTQSLTAGDPWRSRLAFIHRVGAAARRLKEDAGPAAFKGGWSSIFLFRGGRCVALPERSLLRRSPKATGAVGISLVIGGASSARRSLVSWLLEAAGSPRSSWGARSAALPDMLGPAAKDGRPQHMALARGRLRRPLARDLPAPRSGTICTLRGEDHDGSSDILGRRVDTRHQLLATAEGHVLVETVRRR